MKKVFLHFGFGKTGSSYIQSCLAINKDNLKAFGINYPDHHSDSLALKGQVTQGNAWGLTINEIIQITHSADCEAVLFSSEGLTEYAVHKIEDLRKLNDVFDVRCLAYLREPLMLTYSSYRQQMQLRVRKNLDLESFNEYVARLVRVREGAIFRVMQACNNLDKHFNFTALNYEERKGNLIDGVENWLGIEPNTLSQAHTKRSVNRSLSESELYLCHRLPMLQRAVDVLSNTECREEPYNDQLVGARLSEQEALQPVADEYVETVNRYLPKDQKMNKANFSPYQFSQFDRGVSLSEDTLVFSKNQIDVISELIAKKFEVTRRLSEERLIEIERLNRLIYPLSGSWIIKCRLWLGRLFRF